MTSASPSNHARRCGMRPRTLSTARQFVLYAGNVKPRTRSGHRRLPHRPQPGPRSPEARVDRRRHVEIPPCAAPHCISSTVTCAFSGIAGDAGVMYGYWRVRVSSRMRGSVCRRSSHGERTRSSPRTCRRCRKSPAARLVDPRPASDHDGIHSVLTDELRRRSAIKGSRAAACSRGSNRSAASARSTAGRGVRHHALFTTG